ncbi:MAG: hypothetical protein DDT26_01221 [Dehalococcoidia bacterium]|nr:hypothetical protein [Chloroflexota bacterium]
MNDKTVATQALPGGELDLNKMPGHWLMARMGKRVLRPGGLELTHKMLDDLDVQSSDLVVEFAPGLGVTAKLTLSRNPVRYTAVEPDQAAADKVRTYLSGSNQQCLVASAEETGLPPAQDTVVYGEAMLTMQSEQIKHRTVQEANRILRPGGRYAIHELCLVPDDINGALRKEIETALSNALRVGARPLTSPEWRALLEANGFEVQSESKAPAHLLRPKRLIRDEGLAGAVRFVLNVLRNRVARKRIRAIRRVFKQYDPHLEAIVLAAIKVNGRIGS